jgi:tetratricopeptide (TPR) repeat protein
MNKASFRVAFMAVLASTFSGCASPMKMFAKKAPGWEEFKAQHQTEPNRVAGNQGTRGGSAEVSELLHQGHAAYQQGNIQEAQSKYAAVVQRQPNHPVANHRLGVIADRQQDYLTAQRHYFAALNSSPNDPNLLNDIGYSFLLQSRYPEAENYLQGALQKNPKQSNAINNLGLLYAKQGQPDRALAMFRMTNSEAEAQAKLARLMPSGLNAAPPATTMMAQQGWPPQNVPPMSAAPNNGTFDQSPMSSPNNGWTPPDQMPPNNSSAIAQAGGVHDPNMPESTRRILEQMASIRQKAESERQIRDNAERQRQEMLKRQLRDEELARASGLPPNVPPRVVQSLGEADGRPNITNPIYSQPSPANRWNGAPGSAPPSSNAPIEIGPMPNAYGPNQTPWQATPDNQRPPNGTARPPANSFPDSMPNAVPNTNPEPMPNTNADVHRGSVPPTGIGSPLDAMPNWPPHGSPPAMNPNNPGAASSATQPPPNTAWPNGYPPGWVDDPARAASRLGMNAGPGSLFPITPNPNSGVPSAPNSFNGTTPSNGVSPTTPPNWPANPNRPGYGSPVNEPPAGTFGAGNFSTSSNSRTPATDSQGRRVAQDQLPPSEWYQTPGRFGAPSTGAMQIQPASATTNRGVGQALIDQYGTQTFPSPDPRQTATDTERASTRANIPDRFSSNDRWERGAIPGTQSAQTSTPSMQGHLATPTGENSLNEYERMIQQHNAETSRIRQQLDEQRQLPNSENFRRNQTPSPTGTNTGLSARP